MNGYYRLLWVFAGVCLGIAGTLLLTSSPRPALAASNDRHKDFILCTGAAAIYPQIPSDGVWLLDYRSGKLLGTIIERGSGKIASWAEVDLVREFGVQPQQDVHFLMTTGRISPRQAALYLAETSTGKFGVYTMGPRPDGKPGVAIRRHDMVFFRQGRN